MLMYSEKFFLHGQTFVSVPIIASEEVHSYHGSRKIS